MSTRAVIALPIGTDPLPAVSPTRGWFARRFGPRPRFRGVYHHNGGRPDQLGALIWRLVAVRYRGEVQGFWREIITGNPAGWSSLGPLDDDAVCRAWDGSKSTAEAAFAESGPSQLPVTYQGDPRRDLGFTSPPISETSDKMAAEYVYVVCRAELTIFVVADDGRAIVEAARVPWSTPPDWDALGEQIERAR